MRLRAAKVCHGYQGVIAVPDQGTNQGATQARDAGRDVTVRQKSNVSKGALHEFAYYRKSPG